MTSTADIRYMSISERQATIELLATSLERNAELAAGEGDDVLEMALRSVSSAMMSAANEIAVSDIVLAESVVLRALGLLTAFHCRHPQYPVGPVLH
jgi:hypothetical protein